MKPMISQERAYRDALAILTTTQRDQLERNFGAPGYKPTGPLARDGGAAITRIPPAPEIVEAFLAERETLG